VPYNKTFVHAKFAVNQSTDVDSVQDGRRVPFQSWAAGGDRWRRPCGRRLWEAAAAWSPPSAEAATASTRRRPPAAAARGGGGRRHRRRRRPPRRRTWRPLPFEAAAVAAAACAKGGRRLCSRE